MFTDIQLKILEAIGAGAASYDRIAVAIGYSKSGAWFAAQQVREFLLIDEGKCGTIRLAGRVKNYEFVTGYIGKLNGEVFWIGV